MPTARVAFTSSQRYARSAATAALLASTLAGTFACATAPRPPATTSGRSGGVATSVAGRAGAVSEADVHAVLDVLAADSLEGRGTGTSGSARAAAFIADQFRRAGLEAAGDSGYLQRVPLALSASPTGRVRPVLLGSLAARDTVAAERRLRGVNVVGILVGSDPAVANEVVLVDAHYDHLGIGAAERGDSIYNGADDDASGVTAVVTIARQLAGDRTRRPRRTIVFLATTGEEVGLLGTRWYIAHPVRPLTATVANLEIEMIGRPDSLAGGVGRAWLTGYERSTMGDELRASGVPIVADPRPSERFFERSDNIAFARLGIPAHTLSSFNLHADYHHASDDVSRVDYAHMARVIDAAVMAVRLLADGPTPAWKPGGRPVAPTPRAASPTP